MIADNNTFPAPSDESSGTTGDGARGEVTVVRSEERLHIQTRVQPWARARLRRFVVTETQTIAVPVRREYVVLETAPYADTDSPNHGDSPDVVGATDHQAGGWAGEPDDGSLVENAVLIYEEVAEVVTTIRPVARVHIEVERRTEQQTITAVLAREHVEVHGDVQDRRS